MQILPLPRSVFVFPSRVATRKIFAFILKSFLFSFAFFSPYSAYFGVPSDFLARVSRPALRLLLLVFLVARSLSFHLICTQNAVRYTDARHSNMRTLLSSAGVSKYPNYARNRACALLSHSPFHYVMAKIVPVVQLAAHAKSSTFYGRSYGRRSKFFSV